MLAVEDVAVKNQASALNPRSDEPFTESVRHGLVVPSPRFPTLESKKNCETSAFPNLMVEEALIPDFAQMMEEVAAFTTPKLLSHVKGLPPALV